MIDLSPVNRTSSGTNYPISGVGYTPKSSVADELFASYTAKTANGPQLAPGEAGTRQGMIKAMATFEELLILLSLLGKETRQAERNNALMALTEKAAASEAAADKKMEAADKARMGAIANLVMCVTAAAVSMIGAGVQIKQLNAGFSQLKQQGLDMKSIKSAPSAKTAAGKDGAPDVDGAGTPKSGLKTSDAVKETSVKENPSANTLSKDAQKTENLKQDAMKAGEKTGPDGAADAGLPKGAPKTSDTAKETSSADTLSKDAQKTENLKQDAMKAGEKTDKDMPLGDLSKESLINLRGGELNTLSTRVQITGAIFQAVSQILQGAGSMAQSMTGADSQTLQAEAEKLQAAAEQIGILLQQSQSQESDFKEFMQSINNIIREFMSAQQKMTEAVAH